MKEHVKVVTLKSGKNLIESEPMKKSVEPQDLIEMEVTTSSSDIVTPTLKDKGKSIEIGPLPKKADFPLLFPNEGKKKVSFQNDIGTSSSESNKNVESPVPHSEPIIIQEPPSQSSKKPVIAHIPPYIPFPQRLRNQKEKLQFKKFFDVFKLLHINIPLVEAIEQMPSYAKFLKDILSKKKKLNEFETVALTKGGNEIGKALCDLGASINLMPLSVFNTLGIDQVLRRCIPKTEVTKILEDCHKASYGGHFGGQRTTAKVLQFGFFWPTLFQDAHNFSKRCDECQRSGSISQRNEMLLNRYLEVELFDVWGIDFMGPFPPSNNCQYILVAVDFVSKWVEAVACVSNDAKTVVKFLHKQIFSRFGTPRALINDEGTDELKS
ncbi:uncharacterized protein LOC112504285 [Cynara cardunculus var. scolymus]|uniref:uncharacterized protein LOC112504285 n=1 Tax=Cynara cardunculus var. scolymus TaxID=59895 RepID=UPI000D62B149|nr:uncharacterized protein LOC112504285 [Cynara cardunculus var. scolymus]